MDILHLITEVGFPIAASIVSGYFIFLTLKFILDSVSDNVRSIDKIIMRLDDRVISMNEDVQKIDVKISHILGLRSSNDKRQR